MAVHAAEKPKQTKAMEQNRRSRTLGIQVGGMVLLAVIVLVLIVIAL